jgi:hypothetical protein
VTVLAFEDDRLKKSVPSDAISQLIKILVSIRETNVVISNVYLLKRDVIYLADYGFVFVRHDEVR